MNWDKKTEYLVIVNYYDHDISWAQRLKFPYIIYYKDSPNKEPFNAINKAKSESNLLKFITDFYDNLPQNLIIVHQYERKYYHNGSLVDILNDPNFDTHYKTSKTRGYYNFNNHKLGTIDFSQMIESGWWDNCMKPYFGDIAEYDDFTHEDIACAQFVVSRERIHSLPKEFFSNMYDWLITNTLDEEKTGYDPVTLCRINTINYEHPRSSHKTSRYLEWTWGLIFCTYKPTEKIGMILPSGKHMSVLYGAKKNLRDVTLLCYNKFYNPETNQLVLDTQVNMNHIFGDHLYASPKILTINIDGTKMDITEDYKMLQIG